MTSTAASTVVIDELRIPSTPDGPEAAEFREMVDVRNAVATDSLGSDALSCTATELLPVYQAQEFGPKRIFVARVDGRIVGRAVLDWPFAEGSTAAWLVAEVLPAFRRRGIGSELFDLVESLSQRAGRRTLQADAVHRAAPGGQRIKSPTGFGDLPLGDPGVQFLQHRGYRLEQIERVSFLDLPVQQSGLDDALRAAEAAAGDDYQLVNWTGRTPRTRVDDLLVLRTRMSTDAPTAGLDVDEEQWTAARLAKDDDAVETSGRTRLTVAAEYRPTGRLVGFTELGIPRDRSRPAQQLDTLVLAEHRGHRLGMLLKAANLRALNRLRPLPPLVSTFNAEENRHMLDVNEALGFRAAGSAGGWRKDN